MSSKLSRRTLLVAAAGFAATRSRATSVASTPTVTGSAFELERFTEEVKRARAEADSQRAVHEALARAVSDPQGVLAGVGEPSEVGIHTIYRAPDLTILNVIWAPLMVLLPHNHNMWATIGIYTGREDNIIWSRKGAVVEASSAASLSERQVFDLPDTVIHSVTNPIPRLTGAIHIYGGDFFGVARSEWDSETLHERPLDLDAARRSFREANDRFKCAH
jgi:predicted metal-dependent enzyme (double-stranded beta helix superfamily)